MIELEAPDKASIDEARVECDRVASEIAHLESQIATATWKASQLEVPGATPAPNELDELYASIARWRSRLGALLVAQNTAKGKLEAAAAERLASMTAEVRAALQPFQDKKQFAQAVAVEAAKTFAASLRDLSQAEVDRRVAIQRVSSQRFSGGQHDAQQMAEARAILPIDTENEEPLYAFVLNTALTPQHERPAWRKRADHLAQGKAP